MTSQPEELIHCGVNGKKVQTNNNPSSDSHIQHIQQTVSIPLNNSRLITNYFKRKTNPSIDSEHAALSKEVEQRCKQQKKNEEVKFQRQLTEHRALLDQQILPILDLFLPMFPMDLLRIVSSYAHSGKERTFYVTYQREYLRSAWHTADHPLHFTSVSHLYDAIYEMLQQRCRSYGDCYHTLATEDDKLYHELADDDVDKCERRDETPTFCSLHDPCFPFPKKSEPIESAIDFILSVDKNEHVRGYANPRWINIEEVYSYESPLNMQRDVLATTPILCGLQPLHEKMLFVTKEVRIPTAIRCCIDLLHALEWVIEQSTVQKYFSHPDELVWYSKEEEQHRKCIDTFTSCPMNCTNDMHVLIGLQQDVDALLKLYNYQPHTSDPHPPPTPPV